MGAGLAAQSSKPDPEGEQFVLLPPEMADLLARRGLDVAGTQKRLFQMLKDGLATEAKRRAKLGLMAPPPLVAVPERIVPVIAGGVGMKMTCIPIWGGGSTMSVTREIRPF